MIIVRLAGGLGNQMFQYAFGRALALRTQTDLKLDITDKTLSIHSGFELNRNFNIDAKIASEAEINHLAGFASSSLGRRLISQNRFSFLRKASYIIEDNSTTASNIHISNQDVYLDGYWQSEQYFDEIENTIRREFSFKPDLNELNLKVASQIESSNAVSIHVRRNDYIRSKKNASIYYQCKDEYYQSAVSYIQSKIDTPTFFVFSDDVEWAKSHFSYLNNCFFVSHNHGNKSYIDMQLMSMCQHNIIANSTFSWWGAWLNNNISKTVISPKEWFINGKSSKNLIPATWVKL